MKVEVLVEILDLALKYGIPVVREALNTLEQDEVTMDDIEALKARVRNPEQYFA